MTVGPHVERREQEEFILKYQTREGERRRSKMFVAGAQHKCGGCPLYTNSANFLRLLPASVPGREGEVIVLVCVVYGRLQVHDDGVVTRDFGGNVDGHDGEHGVPAYDVEM